MPLESPSAPPPCTSSAPQRQSGLDALRGIAAVFVVLLHAGIPYMTNPMAYLVWPARDVHPSDFVDVLTWCTECFLMPLFFLLAGYFSVGPLLSRGEKQFIESRTKRLMVTQVAAGTFILPTCLLIWSMGWIADGLYAPRTIFIWRSGIPKELEAELYGFGHFWFLHYLYIYCLLMGGASWLVQRSVTSLPSLTNTAADDLTGVDVILSSVWKPMIPVIPAAIILYLDPRIVLGFYQTFIPVGSKLAYYAIYFAAGVTMWRTRSTNGRHSLLYLTLAGVTFLGVLPLIHQHVEQPLVGVQRVLLAGLLAIFASLSAHGLFALFLKSRLGDNVVMKYLADASFWVYIIHLPFVGLTQIAIARTGVPALGKFVIAGTIAVGLSLLTYQAFVRNRWLGEFLEGRWGPNSRPRTAPAKAQGAKSALDFELDDAVSALPTVHFRTPRVQTVESPLYSRPTLTQSPD
ncbi:acyltransferase [Schlesneria sp. T3-172]|uniref:acyltransferase family protein n=1 Tax=Schlesneria sphaerica TaxID=3373610 RepID=UPI0037C6AE9A